MLMTDAMKGEDNANLIRQKLKKSLSESLYQ